jgi:PAT family beta-lactamase induction signal transducer AmpG
MTIAGAIIGGVVAVRIGMMRMLLIGAILVSVTNLAYAWLATIGPEVWALTITVSLENLAGGFGGTALIAYMSSLTSTAFTATQYALFSSAFALPGKLAGGMSGYMVEGLGGFYWFFILTAAMGIPAFLLVLTLVYVTARKQKTGPGAAGGLNAAA